MKPVEIEFLMRNNTKSGFDEVLSSADATEREVRQAQAVIIELRGEIERLHIQMQSTPTMDQSENIAKIEALKAKIVELESELTQVGGAIPKVGDKARNTEMTPKDLPHATRSFNGLHMSIQQIAREMPSLAMGPQMFFLAISNNLPIFADEVARARAEYDRLREAGDKATPVWKQIAGSLFSWQTALTTGIMLLVMYGKEIAGWAKEVLGGKSALDELRESMQKTYEVEKTAHETAAKTRFELLSTMNSIKEFVGTKDEERRKIDELNNKYGETFGYYDTLAGWYDTLTAKAEEYTRILFLQAKQQSLLDKAVEAEDKIHQIEQTPWEDYNTWWGYGGKVDRWFSDDERYKNNPNGRWKKTEALSAAKAERDAILQEIEDLRREEIGLVSDSGLTEVVDGSIQDLENTIAAKRKALKDITNKSDYDAAMAEIKRYETMLEAITGPKGQDKSEEKAASVTEKNRGQLSELELEAQRKAEELAVEAMAEGYEKRRKTALLEFEREKDRIIRQGNERLKLYDDLRKAGADVSPQQRTQIEADTALLLARAGAVYDRQIADIDTAEQKKKQARLEALLKKYQDFEAQRAAIKKKGDEDIAELEAQRTEENAAEIDRAISVARERIDEGIQSINDAEAASASKDNVFLKRLFGDYSSMSFDALKELIAQAKQLQAYLNGKGSAEGITFISAEELKNIEKSPAELDKLRKALDKLLKTGKKGGSNKWSDIFKTFETGLAELKGAKGFEEIAGAIGTISGAATDAAGELAAMFDQMGDTQTADAISGVQQVLGAVSNIGQGFAKGGIIGGIGAAVGEAVNFLAQAFASEARHREALKEIERAKLDFQRQYNLALLEQNLLMKEATNVFGERQIAKAANALQVYKDALAQFNTEMKGDAPKISLFELLTGDISGTYAKKREQYEAGIYGLASAQIVTGHKKTGLFGWGKGKDLYSSVLDVYPELIDANGKLDTAMLQTILDTRKMSDETRDYLENLIELTDAMEEADAAFEDYLTQTFGSLGDGMLQVVKNRMLGITDAFSTMRDDVSAILEDLAEQVIYSLFFAEEFDRLQQELKELYGSGRTEEEIAYGAMDMLDDFYAGLGSNIDAAQAWMEEWKRRAEEMGYDLWKDEGMAQSGRAGITPSMTQEQGTKLEGLMTSLQMHGASIDDKMDDIAEGLGSSLDALNRIAKNTDTLPQILALWQAIKRDGLKMK